MTVCAQTPTRYLYGTRCEPLPPELTIEEQLLDLRRRVAALEHWKIDRQAAHNALATAVEHVGLRSTD